MMTISHNRHNAANIRIKEPRYQVHLHNNACSMAVHGVSVSKGKEAGLTRRERKAAEIRQSDTETHVVYRL